MTRVLDRDLQLRRVFGRYPTGVAVLAAVVDGRPLGLAASSFVPVSLDPPLVSVCVACSSTTWPVLKRASRFGISVLAADQESIGRQLGSRVADRFAGLDWHAGADGAISIGGAAAWFGCSVHRTVTAGDHDIVLFSVHAHQAADDTGALVFHASGYRSLA